MTRFVLVLAVWLPWAVFVGGASAEAQRVEAKPLSYGVLHVQYRAKLEKLLSGMPTRCHRNWTRYPDCKALLNGRARLAAVYQRKGRLLKTNPPPRQAAMLTNYLSNFGLPADCRKLYKYYLAGDRARIAYHAGRLTKRKLDAKFLYVGFADVTLRNFCRT